MGFGVWGLGLRNYPPLPPRPTLIEIAPQVAYCLRGQFEGFELGFKVQGSGFMVQGSGFMVQGSGFRVYGSEIRVEG